MTTAAAIDATEPVLDRVGLAALLELQDGVVSRRQLVELGARPHDVRRMLRRRDLTSVHPGVYVDHTGPLTTIQREWAAVLACWPAALSHESALPAPRRPDDVVHVAVARGRTLAPLEGVVVHRTSHLRERTAPGTSVPRLRVEHAAIDVASAQPDVVGQFRVLADVVQSRRTTARRIADVLETRRGVPGRAVLLELLADLELGACSVLERAYLLLEERHGLTSRSGTGAGTTQPERQRPDQAAGGRVYRDVSYGEAHVFVELDGVAFHGDATARDHDARRDLLAMAADDTLTVRLTYGLVVRDGCRTMATIGTLLARRGCPDAVVACPDCPTG